MAPKTDVNNYDSLDDFVCVHLHLHGQVKLVTQCPDLAPIFPEYPTAQKMKGEKNTIFSLDN